MTIADIINQLKWDSTYDFEKVKVWYVSRGDLQDMSWVDGSDILQIGDKFLETTKGPIPLHRIVRVLYGEKEVFKR